MNNWLILQLKRQCWPLMKTKAACLLLIWVATVSISTTLWAADEAVQKAVRKLRTTIGEQKWAELQDLRKTVDQKLTVAKQEDQTLRDLNEALEHAPDEATSEAGGPGKDDIRSAIFSRERQLQKEILEDWLKDLSAGERVELEKTGAIIARQGGGGSPNSLVEQVCEGAFEQRYGSTAFTASVKNAGNDAELFFTRDSVGKGRAFMIDSEGNVLGELTEFDPTDKGSIENAIERLSLSQEAKITRAGEVLKGAFRFGLMVFFIWDAADAVNKMKNPLVECSRLQDFARLALTGDWDDFTLHLQQMRRDLAGPFDSLDKYLNYIAALRTGMHLSDWLGEPKSFARQRAFKRLMQGVARFCESAHARKEVSSANLLKSPIPSPSTPMHSTELHREAWKRPDGSFNWDVEWTFTSEVKYEATAVEIHVRTSKKVYSEVGSPGITAEWEINESPVQSIDVVFADGSTKTAHEGHAQFDGDYSDNRVTKITLHCTMWKREWTVTLSRE